ncbi:MAG: 16S rRNA (cytidine(1402)-2'-O)-methyltransferase [Acidobacteriota bacterium]
MSGILYLVATPVGNLADLSFRAIETLKAVDLIACEDTRHSLKLLNHYGISKKLISYHEHNERERATELVSIIEKGSSIAVISDAGTPAINDPGQVIVQQAIEAGLEIVPIPGAVAFVNAAIVSGLPTDSLFFGGFLPSKAGERRKRLEEVRDLPATLIFYESPHRLLRSLNDCIQILGPRKAAAIRELTKLHEETIRGTLVELLSHFSSANPKGEFVLVIDKAGKGESEARTDSLAERVAELESSGIEHKAALKAVAKEFGISRSEAYRRLQVSK